MVRGYNLASSSTADGWVPANDHLRFRTALLWTGIASVSPTWFAVPSPPTPTPLPASVSSHHRSLGSLGCSGVTWRVAILGFDGEHSWPAPSTPQSALCFSATDTAFAPCTCSLGLSASTPARLGLTITSSVSCRRLFSSSMRLTARVIKLSISSGRSSSWFITLGNERRRVGSFFVSISGSCCATSLVFVDMLCARWGVCACSMARANPFLVTLSRAFR
mmetsp:Transcript_72700/g.207083  ORF Transcript_72700/g.207083 Transcript_72700/m.207083 type:complete len:220 (+) Transcript_72700:2385-3044(+)